MTLSFEDQYIKLNNSPLKKTTAQCVGYFLYQERFYSHRAMHEFVSTHWINNRLKDIVPELSGCFQLIIADYDKNEVFIAQDRWGTYPMFYSQTDDSLRISSDYRELVNKETDYNPTALAEMVGLGHVLGHKTLLNNIFEFKPHHTCVVKRENNRWLIKEQSYWSYLLSFKKAHFDTKSNDFAQLWNRRMKIISDGIKTTGQYCYVPLSAGLDSRLLAASIDKNQLKQFNFTFGTGDDNLEIETALQVSQNLSKSLGHHILNVNHSGYQLLTSEAPHSYRITTAYFGEKDLWYPYKNRHEIAAVISGHSGDFMAGSHLKTKMKLWRSKDEIVRYIVSFKSTPLCKHLYTHDKFFRETLHNSILSSLDDSTDLINAFIKWDLEERQRRYIVRSMISEQHEDLPLMVLPFFDYELMDFFSELPFAFLRNTELYRHSASKHIFDDQPVMRQIPVNGAPLVPKLKGLMNEYYIKLKDFLALNSNTRVFDNAINWDEFINASDLPPFINDKHWFKKDFFQTNSRFYYALSQFHGDFTNTLKQTHL